MKTRNNEINIDDLFDKLKGMKFSGMADELKNQQEDPNADLLSFEERFEKLVYAEWLLRYNKKFNRFLNKAQLRFPGASIDQELYDPDREIDTATVDRLINCEWIDEGRNLLITGLTGTGKTYIANALAVAALKQFKTTRYMKTSKLLKELDALQVQNDPVGFIKYTEQLCKVDLLILDDFGLMELDLNKCRDLFEIIDGREGRKSTVVISQIPVKDWYDLFKDSTYADACLDRLIYKAYRLDLQGKSMRAK